MMLRGHTPLLTVTLQPLERPTQAGGPGAEPSWHAHRYTHAHTRIHVHVHKRAHICICVRRLKYACMCTQVPICIHAHTDTCEVYVCA